MVASIRDNRVMERNREIGQFLRTARQARGLSVVKCAAAIHTSRRRYAQMEEGVAIIGIAEELVFARFLGIPAHRLWELGDGVEEVDASDMLIAQVPPGHPVNVKFIPYEGGGGAIYLAKDEALARAS